MRRPSNLTRGRTAQVWTSKTAVALSVASLWKRLCHSFTARSGCRSRACASWCLRAPRHRCDLGLGLKPMVEIAAVRPAFALPDRMGPFLDLLPGHITRGSHIFDRHVCSLPSGTGENNNHSDRGHSLMPRSSHPLGNPRSELHGGQITPRASGCQGFVGG